MRWADVYVPHVSPASMSPATMAMGRRLRLRPGPAVSGPMACHGVIVPISARISPGALSPGARCDRSMRWADVYVCMLADGVALRNRCPQGQADPRAAIAGGASGVTMARAGPHPRRARSMGWADVYVPHVSQLLDFEEGQSVTR